MRISIITPSLNQGPFIERTIQSVLSQKGDFDLEYSVIDGGSSDNTAAVVEKYKNDLKWISEADEGQSEAINKGLNLASGDVVAWINSDDTYEPEALSKVAEVYRKTGFDWCIGKCRNIDEHDREIRKWITQYKVYKCKTYSYNRLLTKNFIPQPAVFISRDMANEVGPLRVDQHYTMDYEYWLRIGQKSDPLFLDAFLANFRWHSRSKCGKDYQKMTREAYLTAQSYAPSQWCLPMMHNALHCLVLNLVYRLYDALPCKHAGRWCE
jgi:glycosyltransferase involved in cell wall biosynthesis